MVADNGTMYASKKPVGCKHDASQGVLIANPTTSFIITVTPNSYADCRVVICEHLPVLAASATFGEGVFVAEDGTRTTGASAPLPFEDPPDPTYLDVTIPGGSTFEVPVTVTWDTETEGISVNCATVMKEGPNDTWSQVVEVATDVMSVNGGKPHLDVSGRNNQSALMQAMLPCTECDSKQLAVLLNNTGLNLYDMFYDFVARVADDEATIPECATKPSEV